MKRMPLHMLTRSILKGLIFARGRNVWLHVIGPRRLSFPAAAE